MKKVLIIGGYGFLGKNLNNLFADNDKYLVRNESRRTGLNLLDLNTTKMYIEAFEPDIVINASAKVGGVKYVMENKIDIMTENIQMNINVYKALSELKKEVLVINPLSNCAYPFELDIQLEEDFLDGKLHQSVEPYGVSKQVLFLLGKYYAEKYPTIKTVSLMIPNAFGLFDSTDPSHTHAINGMIIRMILAQKNGDNEFTLYGSGKSIRSWVFMGDIARFIFELIENQTYVGLPEILNVGEEVGVSIGSSCETIRSILGYDVKIVNDLTYPDGAPIKILGTEKLKTYFPNFKFTDYESAIYQTIEYYKTVL